MCTFLLRSKKKIVLKAISSKHLLLAGSRNYYEIAPTNMLEQLCFMCNVYLAWLLCNWYCGNAQTK